MLLNRIEVIEKLTCVNEVWDSALCAFGAMSLDFATYITADQSLDGIEVFTNIPDIYDGMSPADDPFLKYCCTSYDITLTGVDYLPDYAYLPETAKAFITRARKTGFRTGLGIPVRLRDSTRFGGFNLGTRLDRDTFEARIVPEQESLRTFCLMLHRKIEEATLRGAPATTPQPAAEHAALDRLSAREREVATLIAQGYSRKECAQMCDLSHNTVSDYLKSVYRKLGVRNRVHLSRLLGDDGTPPNKVG